MKAVVYHGRNNISVDEVGEPGIHEPTDALIKVTAAGLCGSDLHLFGGYMPGLEDGDVLGHEFVGEVVELGGAVNHVRLGQRVMVLPYIACGECVYCKLGLHTLCDRTNPDKALAESVYGYAPAGMFGHGHLFGSYRGGQAEYARVPYAHTGLVAIPDWLSDEQALSLLHVMPGGYMAAEQLRITPQDTVVIWGAGPVGQFAAAAAMLFGAGRIISIDRLPERLGMAKQLNPDITTINFQEQHDIVQTIKNLTNGHGADKCIDAVGLEAHSSGVWAMYDRAKHLARLTADRMNALGQAINACRKNGVVSVAGTYGGFADKFPAGAAFAKGLDLTWGSASAQQYLPSLMALAQSRKIDPGFIVTHRMPLSEAVTAYRMFRDKTDQCVRVILRP